jgi:hypothetical protein
MPLAEREWKNDSNPQEVDKLGLYRLVRRSNPDGSRSREECVVMMEKSAASHSGRLGKRTSSLPQTRLNTSITLRNAGLLKREALRN